MTSEEEYEAFLASKALRARSRGMENIPDLAGHLFDFQKSAVEFGLRVGGWGCFLSTGLGKSAVELEFIEHARNASNGMGLILTPLAVAQQIARMGQKWGYPIRAIRAQGEAREGINVCNYDRVHLLEPDAFGAVAADESAILKSLQGKQSRNLRESFSNHRWVMGASAVPAPNDHMEIGQQVEFLGILSSVEMLSTYFINDTSTASQQWRLRKHAASGPFWDWMASWCRMATMPSDLDGSDEGFILPALNIHRHALQPQMMVKSGNNLFGVVNVSATNIHDIKRQTIEERARVAADLVKAEPEEPWVIWCDTNYEADAIQGALKGMPFVGEVRGSQTIETKEKTLEKFEGGDIRYLICKPSACGHGLNWQFCARTAFVGRSFSFEQWFQAIRRFWRFLQAREVECHLIVAEGEEQIGRVIDRKNSDFEAMRRNLIAAMRRSGEHETGRRLAYSPQHSGRLPTWLNQSSA